MYCDINCMLPVKTMLKIRQELALCCRLKDVSDWIGKRGFCSPIALHALRNACVEEVVVAHSHIALLLQVPIYSVSFYSESEFHLFDPAHINNRHKRNISMIISIKCGSGDPCEDQCGRYRRGLPHYEISTTSITTHYNIVRWHIWFFHMFQWLEYFFAGTTFFSDPMESEDPHRNTC